MKGTVIISETLLEAVGVIISFIIIVLVVQLVFQSQTQETYQSAFTSVARDISTAIDRAAASSGSLFIQQDLPKGLNVNVSITYKTVIISSGSNAVRKSFSGLTNTPPVNFYNPTTLCIVKTQNDNRVSVVSGICQCNTKDNKCDPSCNAQGVCDPACINSTVGVCNPYCAAKNPGSCDTNCYQNFTTGICEKGCISNDTMTGICSPDCNNVKKGVCSLDCYNQYSNGKTGICDPDCPSKNNLVQVGNLLVKPSDGHCYTGCVNTTTSIISPISNPSPITRTCNATQSGQGDNTDYQCSDNDLWSCGTDVLGCGGHGASVRCSEPCIRFPGAASCCDYTAKINTPILNGTDTVCCCQYNGGTCSISSRSDCLQQGSYAFPGDSQYCQQSSAQNPVKQNNKITLMSDDICDQDCNATSNICDPDCPNSPACQNICSKENEKATSNSPCCAGLVACPGDQICKKASDPLACCGNRICEGRPGTSNGWVPGNKTRWETFYTCPQDCPTDPHTKSTNCQSGSFTESICYTDVYDNSGNFVGFNPVWNNNIIGVCQSAVQQFLDRRNWDINELIKTWVEPAPEGWAWDISRYQNACNRMQSASLTVTTNENYTSSANTCCGLSSAACDPSAQYSPQCLGVGFCIDHSTGVLSILRTLGVPANDVYSVFDLTQSTAHAWVLLKCDPNEPANRQPTQCQGNWGKWLSVDATHHYVALLDPSQYSTICLMWNDQGLYAQTAGMIDATHGYAYDPSIPKSYTADPSLCMYDKLCKQPFGIDCVVP
jgi:type II secretory pathway pseudopilin PulG